MSNYDPMTRLFGYECHGGRQSQLWECPVLFSFPGGQGGKMLDEDYDAWVARKRPFKNEENLRQGQWVKVGDHGYQFLVRLHDKGTLTESPIFHPKASWPGTWELTPKGLLCMAVGPYRLFIVASRDDSIHSGVEFCEGNPKPNAYFKVIHAW